MLFLNPWLLLALAGVSIPVILHLIRRQAAGELSELVGRVAVGVDQRRDVRDAQRVQALLDIIGPVVTYDRVAGHLAGERPARRGTVKVRRHGPRLKFRVDGHGIVAD